MVHSLFASTDDWDNQLEGTESGWPGFFRTLRIYLTHFRGQRSAIMQLMAPVAGTEAEAWETLTAALGLKGVSVGQRWTAPAGVPALSGVVEYVTQSPYDALLRLDKPGPGVAALGAFNFGGPSHGGAELLPLRRSGGRNRRPRDTAVASVDPGTLPDADGAEPGGHPMKTRFAVLAAAILLPTAALAAPGDKPGCADHPLFPTRLPDYKITDSKVTEYDSVRFLNL